MANHELDAFLGSDEDDMGDEVMRLDAGDVADSHDDNDDRFNAADLLIEEPGDSETHSEESGNLRQVPLNALHEARAAQRRLRAQVDQLHQEKAEILARLEAEEPVGQDGQPAPADDAEDAGSRLSGAPFQVDTQLVERYASDAEHFRTSVPDFPSAYAFLARSAAAELQMRGYNQAEATRLLGQIEQDMARRAYRDGVNPAERIYQLARARGYGSPPAPAANGNHTAAAIPSLQAMAAPAAARLETLSKGQQAARSVGAIGGAGTRGEMTLERLSELDGAAFDKAWNTMKQKGRL